MYHFEISDGIETRVDSPSAVHLYGLWQRYHEASGDLPALADMGPERLDWCAANLMVVEPLPDGDFAYRSYGAGIARASGFDMTGKRTSDFRSDVGRFFRDKYAQVLASGRPLYTVHRASHAATVHTWERLMLPVRDGDTTVLVVFNRPTMFRHEFLQGVLESTSTGIVSLAPLRDESGEVVDFDIVSANRAAASLLGRAPEALLEQRLGDTLPRPLGARTLALCKAALSVAGPPGSVEVHGMYNGVHRYLQLNAASSGDWVTLAVADVSELRRMEHALRETQGRLDREIEERKHLESELRGQGSTDALTGIPGRAGFMNRLHAEVARAVRHDRALSVLLIDLDHLHAVNRNHGTLIGDHVLVSTARACTDTLRGSDGIGRLGGEEFAACLPETGAEGALEVAERIRTTVARVFQDQPMLSMQVTVSVGVSQLREGDTATGVLERAEHALREAKLAGRDRVMLASG